MRKPLIINELKWLSVFLSILVVVSVYGYMVHVRIYQQVERLSNGEPYCLLVANKVGYRYRVATSIFDTFGLLMLGGKDRNHAILAVGYKESPKVYHWSHWKYGFEEGVYGPWRNSCLESKFDYENLTSSDYSEKRLIEANGTKYLVPLIYWPNKLGPDSDSGIGFLAKLPDFTPVAESCSERQCNMMHAFKRETSTLRKKVRKLSESEDIYYSFRNYGLETGGLVTSNGIWLPRWESEGLGFGTYFSRNKAGGIVTVISCLGSPEVQCLHEFSRDRIGYTLHYMPDNLPDWRQIEDDVVRFVGGFRVEN